MIGVSLCLSQNLSRRSIRFSAMPLPPSTVPYFCRSPSRSHVTGARRTRGRDRPFTRRGTESRSRSTAVPSGDSSDIQAHSRRSTGEAIAAPGVLRPAVFVEAMRTASRRSLAHLTMSWRFAGVGNGSAEAVRTDHRTGTGARASTTTYVHVLPPQCFSLPAMSASSSGAS